MLVNVPFELDDVKAFHIFSNESIDARTNACAMWECDPYEEE